MPAQAADDVVFVPIFQFFLDFFEREMDNVVVVQFEGRDGIAEAQPQPVQEIDLVGRQVRSMGTEDFVELVPVGHVDFEVELRLLITQFFPGFTDQASLLFRALS